jgi:hypothetical protein
VFIQQGDFALLYTSTPFTLASDASVEPVDSEMAVAATKNVWLKLGSGTDRPVTLHAGKFLVEQANEDLLAGLLPPLVHIESGDASLSRVRSLLTMNERETRQPGPASEFVIERLVELILVEILRTNRLRVGEELTGLVAGLVNPVTARALVASGRCAWLDRRRARETMRCLAVHLCHQVSQHRRDSADRVSATLADGSREG